MDERSGRRLNAVVEHITKHQHRHISVEEMASVCNLSPPAFCRWFKQVFKCSFVAYITERRIENVCRLLETSDMSVSSIGDHVGFESYSNFNRAFTKVKSIHRVNIAESESNAVRRIGVGGENAGDPRQKKQ